MLPPLRSLAGLSPGHNSRKSRPERPASLCLLSSWVHKIRYARRPGRLHSGPSEGRGAGFRTPLPAHLAGNTSA
jgi:hypothetical protein